MLRNQPSACPNIENLASINTGRRLRKLPVSTDKFLDERFGTYRQLGVVDYRVDQCFASREYDTAGKPVTLGIRLRTTTRLTCFF